MVRCKGINSVWLWVAQWIMIQYSLPCALIAAGDEYCYGRVVVWQIENDAPIFLRC